MFLQRIDNLNKYYVHIALALISAYVGLSLAKDNLIPVFAIVLAISFIFLVNRPKLFIMLWVIIGILSIHPYGNGAEESTNYFAYLRQALLAITAPITFLYFWQYITRKKVKDPIIFTLSIFIIMIFFLGVLQADSVRSTGLIWLTTYIPLGILFSITAIDKLELDKTALQLLKLITYTITAATSYLFYQYFINIGGESLYMNRAYLFDFFPNGSGFILLIGIVSSFTLFMYEGNNKSFWALLGIIQFIAQLLTLTRTSVMATLLAIIVTLTIISLKKQKTTSAMAAMILIGTIGVIFYFGMSSAENELVSRLIDPKNLVVRQLAWYQLYLSFLDNPFFGYGLNASGHYLKGLSYWAAQGVSTPHSLYVRIAYETGLIGLFFLGILLLNTLRYLIVCFSRYPLSGMPLYLIASSIGLSIGVIFNSYTDASLLDSSVGIYYWLFIGISIAVAGQQINGGVKNSDHEAL